MELIQQNNISVLNIDSPLVAGSLGELSHNFEIIGRQNSHQIILNMQAVPYVTSKGLNALFQCYLPLYQRKFSLEIQQSNNDVTELLKLTNFHIIASINSHETSLMDEPVV